MQKKLLIGWPHSWVVSPSSSSLNKCKPELQSSSNQWDQQNPLKIWGTTNNMQTEAETSIPRTIVNIGIRHKSVALNKTCRSEIYLILD